MSNLENMSVSKNYLKPLWLGSWRVEPVNIQLRSPRTLIKRTPADIELSVTQSLNIYLYNYQTETTIFIVTKHEKTIFAVS